MRTRTVNSAVVSVPAQQGKTFLEFMAWGRETLEPGFDPLYKKDIVVWALRFANWSPSIAKYPGSSGPLLDVNVTEPFLIVAGGNVPIPESGV